MLHEYLEEIESNIQSACARAGRSRESVRLIAVSKTQPVSAIEEAYALGLRDFGENKVKEMLGKEPQLPEDIRWHLIGHLQTNKVRQVLSKTVLIHSLDSLKLLDAVDFEAMKQRITVEGLLEVNVAEEESKFGFLPEELWGLLNRLCQYKNLKIRGLMTVAPFTINQEDNRAVFRKLKEISIDTRWNTLDNISMDILSMGMTGDYSVAIEEGATMIRVGTGLFGARNLGAYWELGRMTEGRKGWEARKVREVRIISAVAKKSISLAVRHSFTMMTTMIISMLMAMHPHRVTRAEKGLALQSRRAGRRRAATSHRSEDARISTSR